MEPIDILISAGEASGDRYAAELVEEIRKRVPAARFFGCAGPRMRAAGVEAVVEAESLSVVGLVEVLRHIPRIYGELRKLMHAASDRRPRLAILTDSPDFHLRAAARLHRIGVPVAYLVAPQVWAWRKGRVKSMRRNLSELFCIFPFEKEFFDRNGVPATYIGHPLANRMQPHYSKEDFHRRYKIPSGKPFITLLPGSRLGEVGRHMPALLEAVGILNSQQAYTFIWAAPAGFRERIGNSYDSLFPGSTFWERIRQASIQLIEGDTWDAIAHSKLVLAASGTVTMEAALLGTPMVTFYKVAAASWWMGKYLVDVPHYTMVNLVAEKRIVPELMQNEVTGQRLAAAALEYLEDDGRRAAMIQDLAALRAQLSVSQDPLSQAAEILTERYLT